MLFEGLPPDSSCEWRGLTSFVAAYNRRYGTAYARDVCADVEIRDRPAPEVLLRSPGEPPIAIERKSIAWPKEEHLACRRKEERFTERFVEAVGIGDGAFDNALSRLVVDEESLRDRQMREVEGAAASIGSVVASRLGKAKYHGSLAGTVPFNWSFGPVPSWERDETTPVSGVGVTILGRDPLEDASAFLKQREAANTGYREEFQRAAGAAARKFTDHSDCQRLFLVQFFGETWSGPTDEEIEEITVTAPIPESIDQVWVADHHWTSIDSYEVEWTRLR
ncbi:MAG: hypothetical protein F4089_03470 [Gammaproteobacteria bacterium]|nr:hypothetical protein [Dehalococcoidia bacterium]MYJ74202.1 hypothetical protein [Gammaproteobacteria bacterium]